MSAAGEGLTEPNLYPRIARMQASLATVNSRWCCALPTANPLPHTAGPLQPVDNQNLYMYCIDWDVPR